MELPKGAGDPLVRWLSSSEPGHCELFAGAFTLLARAAQHPARLVAGFMGGAWNEDYLMVRNSDAHAWCELYDGHGSWLRFDPTNDGPRLVAENSPSALAQANVRTVQRGWSARFDRMRILWYRRIINFDHADQLALVRSIKTAAEDSGRSLREWSTHWAGVFRDWLSQPWDFRRWISTAAAAALVGVLGWSGWRYGRGWWMRWRRVRGRDIDPVRRKAGRWLLRMDRLASTRETLEVREHLNRLRYGRRESWPVPEHVFSKARKIVLRS
jgi:hypothetical protein